MTYLHDYVNAKRILREQVIPKMIAALMPTLDALDFEYELLKHDGEVDSLIVRMPDDLLPNGYFMRIDFVPQNKAPWKAPDGNRVEGPGF